MTDRATPSAVPRETGALSDLILTKYHDMHRADLVSLVPLVERVEQVHAGDPDATKGLALALTGLAREMEDHMAKDEKILFPAVSAGGGTATLLEELAAPVALENDILFPRFERVA